MTSVPNIFLILGKRSIISVANNKDFSLLDHPDVHIQGDNGMSRGIWIASISGIYIAESLLKVPEVVSLN